MLAVIMLLDQLSFLFHPLSTPTPASFTDGGLYAVTVVFVFHLPAWLGCGAGALPAMQARDAFCARTI